MNPHTRKFVYRNDAGSISLRWQLAMAFTAVTVLAVVAVGAAGYQTTRRQLFQEIDRTLLQGIDRPGFARGAPFGRFAPPDPSHSGRSPMLGNPNEILVRVEVDGEELFSTFPTGPVTDRSEESPVRADHYGAGTPFTVDLDGTPYRVVSTTIPDGGSVQLGRSLAEANRVLSALLVRTLLILVSVSAVAAVTGAWLADRITKPLRSLTTSAETITKTGALSTPLDDVHRDDEVGRLSRSFTAMIESLAKSRSDQERLVQDAGHELRTPLTSLRTNIDTLVRYPDMPTDDRTTLLADLKAESVELTTLVNEVVAVASGDLGAATGQGVPTSVDLEAICHDVASAFRRRSDRDFIVSGTQDGTVSGDEAAIRRAVSCLVDNAEKFSSTDSDKAEPVIVHVDGTSVTVSDSGPGIPPDQRTAVFDRFHRTPEARTLPGSGLGLSIVKQVVDRHQGQIQITDSASGGTSITVTFNDL